MIQDSFVVVFEHTTEKVCIIMSYFFAFSVIAMSVPRWTRIKKYFSNLSNRVHNFKIMSLENSDLCFFIWKNLFEIMKKFLKTHAIIFKNINKKLNFKNFI